MYINKLFSQHNNSNFYTRANRLQEQFNELFWHKIIEVTTLVPTNSLSVKRVDGKSEEILLVSKIPKSLRIDHLLLENKKAQDDFLSVPINKIVFPDILFDTNFVDIKIDLKLWKTVTLYNLKIRTKQNKWISMNWEIWSFQDIVRFCKEHKINTTYTSNMGYYQDHFLCSQNTENQLDIHLIYQTQDWEINHRVVTLEEQDHFFFSLWYIFIRKQNWQLIVVKYKNGYHEFPEKYESIEDIRVFNGGFKVVSWWKSQLFYQFWTQLHKIINEVSKEEAYLMDIETYQWYIYGI